MDSNSNSTTRHMWYMYKISPTDADVNVKFYTRVWMCQCVTWKRRFTQTNERRHLSIKRVCSQFVGEVYLHKAIVPNVIFIRRYKKLPHIHRYWVVWYVFAKKWKKSYVIRKEDQCWAGLVLLRCSGYFPVRRMRQGVEHGPLSLSSCNQPDFLACCCCLYYRFIGTEISSKLAKYKYHLRSNDSSWLPPVSKKKTSSHSSIPSRFFFFSLVVVDSTTDPGVSSFPLQGWS